MPSMYNFQPLELVEAQTRKARKGKKKRAEFRVQPPVAPPRAQHPKAASFITPKSHPGISSPWDPP